MNESTECQALKTRAISAACEEDGKRMRDSLARENERQEAGYQQLIKKFPSLKKLPDEIYDLCGILFRIKMTGLGVFCDDWYSLDPVADRGWFVNDEASFGRYLMWLESRRANPSRPKGFWASLFS